MSVQSFIVRTMPKTAESAQCVLAALLLELRLLTRLVERQERSSFVGCCDLSIYLSIDRSITAVTYHTSLASDAD